MSGPTKLATIGDTLLRRWHRMLNLPHQTRPWYRERLRDELFELRRATTQCQKLSETSDIFFAIIRGRYDGFSIKKLPTFVASRPISVYLYMLAKYTLRWGFYRTAAFVCKAPSYHGLVCEVVNPEKDFKLAEVASRNGLDPVEFQRVGRWLRRVWPLLPQSGFIRGGVEGFRVGMYITKGFASSPLA